MYITEHYILMVSQIQALLWIVGSCIHTCSRWPGQMPWGLSCSASLLCVWNKDHNCTHCCTWRFLTVLIFQTCVVCLHEKEVPPGVRICEEQNHHPPDIQHAVPFRIEVEESTASVGQLLLDMTCLHNRSGFRTPRFFVFLFTGQSLISPFHHNFV
jgi:hypothetical protein